MGSTGIHYSDPIWPDKEAPSEQEVDRLMKASLALLEEKISAEPGQWLWSHNRWKQQTPEKLKKAYRHESILIVLPREEEELEKLLPHLGVFREIYPREFITVYAPEGVAERVQIKDAEVVPYAQDEELFKRDLRFKLVFNLTQVEGLERHFLNLAAFHAVSLKELQRGSGSFAEALKRTTLRAYAS